MNPRPVRLGDLVGQALSDMEIMFEVAEITPVAEGDLDLVLMLDERWEREALKNVLKNCIEHSPAGTTLTLKAEDCGLFARLLVTDQGEGIAANDLPHIFERFYKAKNSSEHSVGIGLALAKAVLEAEEGYITADSEIGKGTTFTLRWRVRREQKEDERK